MTEQNDRGSRAAATGKGENPTQALPRVEASTQALPQRGGGGGGGGGDVGRHGGGRPATARSLPQPGPGTTGTSGSLGPGRAGLPRPGARPEGRGALGPGRPPVRSRRAKLALRRIDPWSVFLFSLLASIFLGIVLVVAVFVLYSVLSALGVLESVNQLFGEVTGDGTEAGTTTSDLITGSRVLTSAAVVAAIDVVLLTALSTLGAMLYNLCASLTGGIEVTLGERD